MNTTPRRTRSVRVKEYLDAGKALEEYATLGPWQIEIGEFEFIADARERLPKYRKALEAVLKVIDDCGDAQIEYTFMRAIQESLAPATLQNK